MARANEKMNASVVDSLTNRAAGAGGDADGLSPGKTGSPPSIVRQNQGRSRLVEAALIEVDRIIADPDQPRSEFDDESLTRLAASLKERGQLQPIRVRWHDVADRYVVVVGERRWRAARLAGLTKLACVVADGTPSAEDLLEDQLVENALREDLKPIEQARAFKALMAGRGLNASQLAERLRISVGSVSKAIALLELPESVQDDVEAGNIPPGTAYEISKVEDPREQAALARQAARGRLHRDDIGRVATKPGKGRGAAGAKTKKITTRIFRSSAGAKVTVELKRGLDAAAILAAIEEFAAELREESRSAA